MHGAMRGLCAGYIVAAGSFATFATIQTHPDYKAQFQALLSDGDAAIRNTIASWQAPSASAPKQAAIPQPGIRGAMPEAVPARPDVASAPLPDIALPKLMPEESKPAPKVETATTTTTTTETKQTNAPSPQEAKPVAPVEPVAVPPLPADEDLPPETEVARVQERLRNAVSDELYQNFDLYLYVSKAEQGPWAQHMYVFQKTDNALSLLHAWPVSTGRDLVERRGRRRIDSITPEGLFELDPARFFVRYHSAQWDAPMPYAMFFNYMERGYQSGIAIHSSGNTHAALLGQRASAGCIRLGPQQAEMLFRLVKKHFKGDVPRFVMDENTQTMSKTGTLARTDAGEVDRFAGYRVLVMVENYGGENNLMVSALF